MMLAHLQHDFDVQIITQNIDDLHERAGSKKVLHLHGEIFKMRSEDNASLIYEIRKDIHIGDIAADGAQLRPDIVWFEEPVPLIEEAANLTSEAAIFVIIGTSLAVYPAAGLINYTIPGIPKFIVDKTIPRTTGILNLTAIALPATSGVEVLKKKIMELYQDDADATC